MPIRYDDHAAFAHAHDRWLDPPDDGPECECYDEDGDPLDHDECHNEDCDCPLHEHYQGPEPYDEEGDR